MSALVNTFYLVLKIDFLLNLLFPVECILCHRQGNLLCKRCYQLIQFYPSLQPQQLQVNQGIDAVYVLAYYQPPIKNLIQSLKYQRVKSAAKLLAELIYCHLDLPAFDLISYVPSSKLRLSNRGFNQSQLIAHELSQLLNRPCRCLLDKIINSKKQASLVGPGSRLHNLDNTFALHKPILTLQDKKILLIDDVISTGATLSQCAKTLTSLKPGRIVALTIARS